MDDSKRIYEHCSIINRIDTTSWECAIKEMIIWANIELFSIDCIDETCHK